MSRKAVIPLNCSRTLTKESNTKKAMKKSNAKKAIQRKICKKYKESNEKTIQKNIQKTMQKIQKMSRSPSPTLHAGVDLVNGMHFCLFEALKLNTESRDRSLFKIKVKGG